MVKSFQFARLPKIHFGKDTLWELPGIVRKYGDSIVLVTSGQTFLHSDASANLLNRYESMGIGIQHLTVSQEPSPSLVDEAATRFRKENIQVVVAIGGGSVMDAGKALSAMLTVEDSVMDFLEGVGTKQHPGTKIPFIALPTTSGTGSEATKNAVLSKIGDNGFKRSLRHDNFVPDAAIVDPMLTLTCPPEITAASGMDCFTQLTEAYLSTHSSEYTDALALEGLKSIKSSLEKSFLDGSDIEARTGMSFAALTSGICLANAGLGAVHGFASSIGGMYQIPHGVLCGTLMAVSNEINVRELRKNSTNPCALKKYALLGMLFLDDEGKTDAYYMDGFIEFLHNLTGTLNLPGLGKFGIKENDFTTICSKTEIKNNPVKLSSDDLIEILTKRC
jgi:alcohol dehydrogenase class IV